MSANDTLKAQRKEEWEKKKEKKKRKALPSLLEDPVQSVGYSSMEKNVQNVVGPASGMLSPQIPLKSTTRKCFL